MNTKLALSAFVAALVLAACAKQEATAPEAAPADPAATEAPAPDATTMDPAADPAAAPADGTAPTDGTATTETPPADSAETPPQQ